MKWQEGIHLTIAKLEQVISKGESLTVEFKTWIHTKDMRERISLAVEKWKEMEQPMLFRMGDVWVSLLYIKWLIFAVLYLPLLLRNFWTTWIESCIYEAKIFRWLKAYIRTWAKIKHDIHEVKRDLTDLCYFWGCFLSVM